jgi:hypothetical protein
LSIASPAHPNLTDLSLIDLRMIDLGSTDFSMTDLNVPDFLKIDLSLDLNSFD